MEANTWKVVWKKPFANAHELAELLDLASVDTGTPLDEIAVDACANGDRCKEKAGTVVLEAEALSDASIVYDITIH